MRVDTIGMAGGWAGTLATTARNSANTGSINGEWNACDTRSVLVRIPATAAAAVTSATSASGPETTTEVGELTAATTTDGSSSSGRDPVLVGGDGGHGPTGRERTHQAAAGGDDGARVGQGPDAGHVGGRQLADGVPDQVVGGDSQDSQSR